MLNYELFAVAFSSLRANKLRSFLTMLGVVIGIASVIAMVALGTGAQRAVQERIGKLGTTLLQIDEANLRTGGVAQDIKVKVTAADAKMIADRSPHITHVQVQQDANKQVTYKNRNTNVRIQGVSANFLEVRKFSLSAGRMFTEAEDDARHKVAVLGASVLTQLSVENPEDIIGERIRIGGFQFEVVGVMEPKGQTMPGQDPDAIINVPFQTGRYRIFGRENLDDIFALAASDEDIPAAMGEIADAMRHAHRRRSEQPDDFRIRNQSDFLQTMNESTQVFTLLLSGVAAVSLLVGGIGIMNIMLVSVTERTREIGIRKAMGATRRTILLQFLVEAVTLCLAGGIVGVAVGVGGSYGLHSMFGWNTQVTPLAVVVSVVFAGVVGIGFGVWPAKRAAALDPIVALRFE